MKVIAVIPAFNEEKKLAKVLNDVKKEVDSVVVVDDGSSDKTYSEARNSGAIVLRHAINRGQGAALRTGTKYAQEIGAEVIVHFDADGQFLAKDIKAMVAPIINNEADVVFGSRFLEKRSDLPWSKEYIIMPIARAVNRVLANVKLTDPQSGFRALNPKAAERIAFQHDGSAHCSEIMFLAHKHKLTIKEVPITVLYNDYGQGLFGGKGRGVGGLKVLRDLLISKLVD
jgi:glycosyltransferase involved in cell wall biosynthesis